MSDKMQKKTERVIYGLSFLTDQDIYLFKQGNHFKLYEKLGAHPAQIDDEKGTLFSVWAPNAKGYR